MDSKHTAKNMKPRKGHGHSHVLGCLCRGQRDDLFHKGCELLRRVLAAAVAMAKLVT